MNDEEFVDMLFSRTSGRPTALAHVLWHTHESALHPTAQSSPKGLNRRGRPCVQCRPVPVLPLDAFSFCRL